MQSGSRRGAKKSSKNPCASASLREPLASYEAANFSSLIASELLTIPPTRLVA